MTLNTFTRPGYADIRLFGPQFSATNYHAANSDARWITGIYTDLRTWKKRDPDDKAWFVEVIVLGFGIGVCR